MNHKRYFVAYSLLPWDAAQVDGKPVTPPLSGSIGVFEVFDDEGAAREAHPKALIVPFVPRRAPDDVSPCGGTPNKEAE